MTQGGAPGGGSENKIAQSQSSSGGVVSPDGNSITYPNGITVYKDGHWTHPVAPGVIQSYEYGSLKPTKIVDPNYKSEVMDKSVEKMMIDRKLNPFNPDGTPIKTSEAIKQINEFDTKNGVLSPIQEKVAQQVATQLANSRNPAIRNYYNLKPKLDSIILNINSKPLNERNGVDDAYLLNAAAGIENADRATNINDYREMLRAAGYRGNLEVMTERLWGLFNNDPKYYTNRGTRLLPDDMVRQLQQNAERAIEPRKKLFLDVTAPLRERIKSHGIPENQIFPDGVLDDHATASKAQPSIQTPAVGPSGSIYDQSKKMWFKLRPGGNPAVATDYAPDPNHVISPEPATSGSVQ
jgi:hypothetical protein